MPLPLQTLSPPLISPLRETSPHGYFGARRPVDLSKPFDHWHQGVDLTGKPGEDVLAVGDGVMVKNNPGMGQLVAVLQLDDGRAVVYADLGRSTVSVGVRVSAGEKIGTMNQHGFVHVAIRPTRYGEFLDPTGIIPYRRTHGATPNV